MAGNGSIRAVSSEATYLQSHKTAVETGQKFDYWVASIIAAIIWFAIQDRNAYNGNALELAAIVVLLVAFIAAFRKINISFLAANVGHDVTSDSMQIEQLREALRANTGGAEDNRGFHTPDQMRAEIKDKQENVAEYVVTLEKLQRRSTRWYNLRQTLLVVGFILLVVSKLLPNHAPSDRDHQREENKQ